jgi:hypothetical protein
MISLYSLDGAWPDALPFRVRLPEGSTRTDPATFTSAELSAWGYTGPFTPPAFDNRTEVLEWTGSEYEVRPMTSEERQVVLDTQWSDVRSDRNRRLINSDWTQLPDAPVDKTAWAAYRQELRDVTKQTDPFDILWPSMPQAQS